MSTSSKPRQDAAYHPRQVLICGYSGRGKTTLITKLIRHLSAEGYAVGYAKHDGHKFQMDKEGKDTALAYAAGAELVTIGDSDHRATITRGDGPFAASAHANQLDLMLVEGHKQSALGPKILLQGADDDYDDAVWQGVFLQVGDSARPSSCEAIPFCHRDDIEAIAAAILARLKADIPAPVGIVLAGGQSRRMGRDKALLPYHGKPQAEHLSELLSFHCERVAISANGALADALVQLGCGEVFEDSVAGFGPLGGLATAMARFPGQPLMVVACDLPFVDDSALEHLLAARDPLKAATCFASESNGLPEPMFAIYEPSLQPAIWAILGRVAAGQSKGCPRKLLLSSRIKLLPATDEVNLANANSPADYERIKGQLAASPL